VASIAIWSPSTVTSTTTSSRLHGAVRPEYEPAFGIFAELLDCLRSGTGCVGTIDPVPERRRVNLLTPVSSYESRGRPAAGVVERRSNRPVEWR